MIASSESVAKPHHMIAPGSSRYSSNDMVHNHYLEEAKKKTQESSRNSEPSVMPSARSQSTTNGTSLNPTKEGLRVWLLKRLISEKPGLQGIFI
ncbi:hypothetical protein Tco_0213251 [Tanacetum coccineum]